jgi:hypothetical protein
MSSETSSRSTPLPNSLVSVVSNAVEWVVNGGAVLPKEWTMRTRLASAAIAEPVVSVISKHPSNSLLQMVNADMGLTEVRPTVAHGGRLSKFATTTDGFSLSTSEAALRMNKRG